MKVMFEAIARIGDTILVAQPDGRVSYVNQAGTAILGEVAGQDLKNILGADVARQLLFQDPHCEWKGELSLKRANGSTFDAFLSSTPILENDQLTSVVTIIHDVTREKAAREALVQSEKLVTLGQLVAGTSHELNNPLAIVTGYADLLLEDSQLTSDQRSKVESIRRNALRASNIIHSMMTFARTRKPEKVRTDLNAVIKTAVQLKEYDLQMSSILLETEFAPDLPPVFIDRQQIEQVLLNLINNAQDAVLGESGSARIILRTKASGDSVFIEVEDSGVGISKNDLKRVFDPFFTTKPVGKGTGLGLSIAHGILHEHGGDIRIESSPSQGTRVLLELPVDHSSSEIPFKPQHAVKDVARSKPSNSLTDG